MSRVDVDNVDSFYFGFSTVSPSPCDFKRGHVSSFFEIESKDFGSGTSDEGIGGRRVVA
jgi:hypothetical protein